MSPQRLERNFVRDGNLYRIRKDVREMAVFAVQNVIKDAPFTKLDMISCHNLLIHLNADVQKRLIPVFHYSLKPGGLLFLGPSPSERKDVENRVKRCAEGENTRAVACNRLDKSGRQHKGLLTLSLLTDDQARPEAISMTFKDLPS